ncbi:MAG: hemolysin [Bacteroidetes bacterium]|nr:MAG: hemolysin [Bacteroidota bacterium]
MESDNLIPLFILGELNLGLYPLSPGIFFSLAILVLLLICSALISGSEVAFFSLSPGDIDELESSKSNTAKRVINLHQRPEHLLGTVLVVNNFVNVGVVILSSYITNSIIDFSQEKVLGFIFQIIFITFILLLFGEIIPKVFAHQYAIKFALFMSGAILFLEKLFKPVIHVLISSTSFVNKRLAGKKTVISMTELSDALDLSSTDDIEDEHILKGIVKFGNIDVQEIMKSRMDVFAIDVETPFSVLLKKFLESGYSRIPIYAESFDTIKGILYIKDLLPYLHKDETFKWRSLIRPPYYVPESKKINDLLAEFQEKKIHLAIVIDEYGGTSGIVTLEDILEEIVGEIIDESDEDESFYNRLNKSTYIFEGKTLLNDFYKVFDKPVDIFDEIKGEADTLAGLILEIKGEIPAKDEVFTYDEFIFKIDSVDNRRIKKIRVILRETENDKE